jgi:phenylalanine-4-hydroxylase
MIEITLLTKFAYRRVRVPALIQASAAGLIWFQWIITVLFALETELRTQDKFCYGLEKKIQHHVFHEAWYLYFPAVSQVTLRCSE